MGTYGELKTNIATDLTRSDLTAEIVRAIDDAIQDVEGEKFPFNSVPVLKPTVATEQTLSIADMVQIDRAAVLDENGNDYPLFRSRPWVLRQAMSTSGRPNRFAIEHNTLLLDPTPEKVYQIRLYGISRAPAFENDQSSNIWTNEGEQLVRAVAEVKLYRDVIKEPEMVGQAMAAERRARKDLRKSARTRLHTGRVSFRHF